MVGAHQDQFDQYYDLLKCFGPKPQLIGPVGHAATLKLALNHLIASHATSFSFSLGLIEKSGIDVDIFMSILNGSSLMAPMYAKKLPNWINHTYENPNFPLKHLIKDVDLILEEAHREQLNTHILAAIREVLGKAEKEGLSESDYSAVYEVIKK